MNLDFYRDNYLFSFEKRKKVSGVILGCLS